MYQTRTTVRTAGPGESCGAVLLLGDDRAVPLTAGSVSGSEGLRDDIPKLSACAVKDSLKLESSAPAGWGGEDSSVCLRGTERRDVDERRRSLHTCSSTEDLLSRL